MTKTEYETTAGTEPDIDEQHEPRTITRTEPDGEVYMMTEIQDGGFVQWGTCGRCGKRVAACKDKGGPVEPDYIKQWRTERFTRSFEARGAEPPLPVAIKTRQRTVDAVLRLLRGKGWTIEAPAKQGPVVTKEEIIALGKDMLVKHHPTLAAEYGIDGLTEREGDDFMDALAGDQPNETDNIPIGQTEEETPEAVAVDSGLDSALAAARARAKEDTSDAGF